MSDAQDSPKAAPASDLQIRYVYPADHHSAFANHFVVHQNAFGEFRLSFFELREPIVLGTTEERQQKLKDVGHVDAVCVGEVVITKPRMAQVLAAILENFSKNPGKPAVKTEESPENQSNGSPTP